METVFILFWKQVDAVLCDKGEIVLSKFTTAYFYLDNYDMRGYFGFGEGLVTVPDIGEVMYLQKNFVYNYFRVKERIFDSRGNVVHILVEKVKIEDSIRLKGHNW